MADAFEGLADAWDQRARRIDAQLSEFAGEDPQPKWFETAVSERAALLAHAASLRGVLQAQRPGPNLTSAIAELARIIGRALPDGGPGGRDAKSATTVTAADRRMIHVLLLAVEQAAAKAR
jgi:hypothetical protein